ncbi:chondroitin AC/alginate lyase [Clavulina sp. PMI_390]|nr:chondroitin AC/alginate lyase [Clavulina sp. PMI_390]
MFLRSSVTVSAFLVWASGVAAGNVTNYANAFVDPKFILNKSAWNKNSTAAQAAIVGAAQTFFTEGPWAVTNKTILPPSNNTHDYLSYAPYYWPDCSNVHNTTQLTQQEINNECKFVDRDGQFVPDQHSVDNVGAFYLMGDAIFYSAMAWAITGDGSYAANIDHWIDTWFVNNATAMTPNLNYAQLVRGVGMNIGTHTGVLDLKGLAKIASAVLTLRQGNVAEWTQATDNGFKAWLTEYLPWLRNNTLGVQERETPNNHGSFYYNQEAAVHLILGDEASAKATLEEYFNGIYQKQIAANGEQPMEASRTHPIHYRAYNLAGVITNAALAQYVGIDAWNITTSLNGTIQKATDWAMAQSPIPSNELGAVSEINQIVACVANIYGDPTGKYKQWLSSWVSSCSE